MFLIRILTAAALFSLLFTTGLRLTLGEIHGAVPLGRRFLRLALLQFGLIPILTVAGARTFPVPAEVSMAMLLLGAAPFAPVVPVFTRMARGDLAMAAGLTAVFPVLSAVLTPLVCRAAVPFLPSVGELRFDLMSMLVTLLVTAPLPLVLGLAMRARFPGVADRIVGSVDVVAQTVGAVSLVYIVASEADAVLSVGLPGLAAMALIAEISWVLGWLGDKGNPRRGIVLGLGALNRNMALALLVAAGSFPRSGVVAAVASLGLLLIALGLVHVGIWRWTHGRVARGVADG